MNVKRYYTPVEANRAIAHIEPLVRGLSDRAEVLRGLGPGGGGTRPPVDTLVGPQYFRELMALSEDLQRLKKYGCMLKDLESGIVDFPARLKGREVLLCWRLGEDSISHWHEVDAGFRGRQPIDAVQCFEGDGSEA